MATQTNSLVSFTDSPALNSLLKSLHTDLTVVGAHQEDLAQRAAISAARLKDCLHTAYGGTAGALELGQHLRQPGVVDPGLRRHRGPACAHWTRCFDEVLGSDPLGCGSRIRTTARGRRIHAIVGPGVHDDHEWSGKSNNASKSNSSAAVGPNSGLGGLEQLLDPLLRTKK